MGLFDKKIQCTYCKKLVKEEYAKNVGICPHCSKRLTLPSSNSFTDSSNASNSYSGSSNASNSYSNSSNASNSYSDSSNASNSYSGSSNASNSNSNSSNTSNNYSNSSNASNSYSNSSNTSNNYSNSSNFAGKRPAIDSDYIRQVNAEANAQSNKNVYSARNNSGNLGYNKNNVAPVQNRAGVYRTNSNNFGKIFIIVFIAIFVLSSILPIIFGIIGMIFLSNTDSDDASNNTTTYYYDEEISYTTDTDGTSYRFPTSVVMTTFLPQYFGKSMSDINYMDLCSIKGFVIDYDYSNNQICIYLYEKDSKNYTDFIENGFIDTDGLSDNLQRYNLSLPEGSSAYEYMNDLLHDMNCFSNLEYFGSNYSFTASGSFEECENLKAFVAPHVSLYSDSLNKEAKIEYLSVFDIEDEEVLDNLTNLKSLRLNSEFDDVEDSVVAVLEKCSKLDSLYVKNQISNSTLSNMEGMVNLDVMGITSLNNLTCYGTLETLTLRFSSLSDFTPISKYTHLTSLNISDDTISDYSSLASLSGLRSLTLAPLNHDITHKVSALSSLTNLEYLSIESIDDTEFVKSLRNIRELELSHIYDNTIKDIITNLPNLDTLTLDYIFTSDSQNLGYISSIENINELTIKNSYIMRDLTDLFITDSLWKLTLDGCTFYADGYKFEDNNSIMYLNITNCSYPDYYMDSNNEYKKLDYSIADLAAYMNCFKCLCTLNMEGCGLSSSPNVVDGVDVIY